MYCHFCGKKNRDDAVFCSECGNNLLNGNKSSGKKLFPILASIIVVALLVIIVRSFASPSIVGVWMDGTDKVVFTKDGDYKHGTYYGTYTITSDKTLEIEQGEYSDGRGISTYKWGTEAKDDSSSGYWYISGGTLYIWHGEYTKK